MLHFYSNILKPRELVQSSLDCFGVCAYQGNFRENPYLLSTHMHAWGFIVLNQIHDGEKHYSRQSLHILVCQAQQRCPEVLSPTALSFPFPRPSELKAKQRQGFLGPPSSLPVPFLVADLTCIFS